MSLVVFVVRGDDLRVFVFFFFKQKTAYEMLRSLVGSEMCIRDRRASVNEGRAEEFFDAMNVGDQS